MIKIWSIKKDNSAAEKKKSKVSAAQIRVQKGKTYLFKKFCPGFILFNQL